MKVTDLMVGDWVMNACDTPRKVYELVQDQVTYELEGGGLNTAHCNQLYPIPLTEDILVKNGFEKNYNDDAPVEECYFYRLFAKPCGWLDIDAFGLEEELGAEFTYHDINVNYVHQLQHLLRLCGIEKEIEL